MSIDKIFNTFNKVNTTVRKVDRMQSTVDRVVRQKDDFSRAKSKGKLYWLILIVIVGFAILSFFT